MHKNTISPTQRFFNAYIEARREAASLDLRHLPPQTNFTYFFERWAYLNRHPYEIEEFSARRAFQEIAHDFSDVFKILSSAKAIKASDFLRRDRGDFIYQIRHYEILAGILQRKLAPYDVARVYRIDGDILEELWGGKISHISNGRPTRRGFASRHFNRGAAAYSSDVHALERTVQERKEVLISIAEAARETLAARPAPTPLNFYMATNRMTESAAGMQLG